VTDAQTRALEETRFQFIIRANGGRRLFALRLVVGVVIPSVFAVLPPHTPFWDLFFGALVTANAMLFMIFCLLERIKQVLDLNDEVLELAQDLKAENGRLRSKLAETCAADQPN